jgi:transposase
MDVLKHADETGWRNDGQSGYAWLFCTALVSIFLFKNTRSSSVPKGVFGEKNLPGILVVDRYNAYNKLLLKIQYCYAHLLRDLEKLEKDFPDDEEVKVFTGTLIPLLAQAMHLGSQDLPDYYRQAKELKKQIMTVCRSPALHLGIRAYQDIFTTHEDRLFHWVEDRRVPAHNNRAERELRPTVIARKVSFGSSSDAGAETRSILMSVLHTLNKQRGDKSLESVFKAILDKIADDPTIDVASLIMPGQKRA